MGQFATGVAAVTGLSDGRLVGFVVQSFVSLSIDPPQVLFCPQKNSSSWPQVKFAGEFCINVLSKGQRVESEGFAIPGYTPPVAWTPSPRAQVPVLDNALAYIECSLSREIDAGDHTIAICSVTDLAVLRPQESPLIYFRGEYRGAM